MRPYVSCREYWMFYRGQGYRPWGGMIRLLAHTLPLPVPQLLVSLSQSSCVSPVELLAGGRGARSQIIWARESLALYKSFNTLWSRASICCRSEIPGGCHRWGGGGGRESLALYKLFNTLWSHASICCRSEKPGGCHHRGGGGEKFWHSINH